MVVTLLIVVPLTIFAGMLAGGAWRLNRAYRGQYVEDYLVSMFVTERAEALQAENERQSAAQVRRHRRPPAMRAAA